MNTNLLDLDNDILNIIGDFVKKTMHVKFKMKRFCKYRQSY